jgi:error-prone DNA polymerase
VKLAEVGALNSIGALPKVSSFEFPVSSSRNSKPETRNFHRRDALWHAERAARQPGILFADLKEKDEPSPLARMTDEERLVADFRGTGLTVGPHPMSFHRKQMTDRGVFRAIDLPRFRSGKKLKVAGCVIARQRPGTAKGFVFLSLEDETGIANAIVTPDLYDRYRFELAGERFLLVEGVLQNLDNVISVKAERVEPLRVTAAETSSHDFH